MLGKPGLSLREETQLVPLAPFLGRSRPFLAYTTLMDNDRHGMTVAKLPVFRMYLLNARKRSRCYVCALLAPTHPVAPH